MVKPTKMKVKETMIYNLTTLVESYSDASNNLEAVFHFLEHEGCTANHQNCTGSLGVLNLLFRYHKNFLGRY